MSGIADSAAKASRRGGRSRQIAAYEGAFEASFAVLAAGGLGYAADRWLGSDPIGVLVGIVLGFAAMVIRLVRLGRELETIRAAEENAAAGDSSDDEGAHRRD